MYSEKKILGLETLNARVNHSRLLSYSKANSQVKGTSLNLQREATLGDSSPHMQYSSSLEGFVGVDDCPRPGDLPFIQPLCTPGILESYVTSLQCP